MTTKLTLSIDSKVIDEAKRFAKKNVTSLSKLIEENLKRAVGSRNRKVRKRSIKELSGMLGSIPSDFDYREAVTDYLIQKHSNR